MSLRNVVVALLATVVLVSALDRRPTKDEWKGEKAGEKAAVAAKAARQAKMAAVDKVILLLEGLQAQVMEEGEKEAATYNKFACFCKDTSKEKSTAIMQGEDDSTRLSASINDLSSMRDNLDTLIDTLQKDIKKAEGEMKEAVGAHQEALAVYTKNEADLAGALEALNGAIKVIKGSKNPSMMQMQSIVKTVRSAAMMADVLGLGGPSAQRAISLFLQQAPGVPMEDYNFHSEGIVATLEQLLKDFTDEKTELDAEEVKRLAAHDAFMQEKTDYVKKKNGELESAKKDKANKIAQIASDSQALSTVAATLLDDKEYMKELSQMCSDKAKTWDTRIKVRQDELSALTAAIGIVKNGVQENTSAASVRLAQQGSSVRLAEEMARSDYAMEADEAAAESAEAPVFLQQRALGGVEATSDDGGRQAIVSLLQDKGKQFRSTLLTSLASTIAADPLAKVKQLIQDLIERLLTEAANEANQKGWCDKATADAEQKRDNAATEISDLNSQMATLEATRDKLTEELEILASAIKELKDNRKTAEEERTAEQAENEATVTEAAAGQAAVESAIDVLDKFYKTAAKSTVDLSLAQGPLDDAPDAGFETGEAYTGAGGEAGGILGMLDVIKSDFERTVMATQKAEKKAAKEFLGFMTETGKSLAVKTTAHEQKTTQKDNAENELEEASAQLQSNSETLQTSVKELLELKPVCVDTGMSYEERVQRREDEIEALNKAMCILKAYAEYGADGIGDKC